MDFKARRKLAVAVSAILTTALGAAVVPPAEAAMSVIDMAAVRQLVAQVGYWQEQLSAMANELAQLQQTHAALTGDRGMQSLLPTTPAERNYLPETWEGMVDAATASTRGVSGATCGGGVGDRAAGGAR